jgi:hypothetical protein
VNVAVREGVLVKVGVCVGVAVRDGVGVGVAVSANVAEFICFGVPFSALPFASLPLRVTPSFDAQFASLSAASGFLRSIE